MQTIILYRYKRKSGGVTVSPIKPSVEYTELYRLIANTGKVLTRDGENVSLCIDVEKTAGWYEIDAPNGDLGV